MQLSPTLLRMKNAVSSQMLRINLPAKKNSALQFFRKLKQKISWKSPRVIATLSITAILAGGLTFYLGTTTSVAAVTLNGQQIGYVQSAEAGNALLNSILEQEGQPFGLAAKTHDTITYKNLRVKPATYQASVVSMEALADGLSYYFDGYKLEANGELIAVLPSLEAAEKVLKDYQDHFVKPSDTNQVASVGFAENITLAEMEAGLEQVKQSDEALQALLDGKVEVKDYTVQEKDSWWLIARKNDMLTDEVLAGNPGTTKDTTLQPGQVIKLVNSTPYLTVVSTGTYTGPESIPYDVITKTDSKLDVGETKVVTEGSSGSKLVTYSYEQKNGVDVTKKIIEEKILQEPVDKVIAKGPNDKPVTVAMASRGSSSGSSGSSISGSSIVSRALGLQGSSYVYGGTGGGGYDCSGFTKAVYSASGISIPRTSYAQFSSGSSVAKSDLQPGDLVFFSTYASGASHVGIYTGGGNFVHASTPSSGVITSSMSDSFYSSRYLGARRY